MDSPTDRLAHDSLAVFTADDPIKPFLTLPEGRKAHFNS